MIDVKKSNHAYTVTDWMDADEKNKIYSEEFYSRFCEELTGQD